MNTQLRNLYILLLKKNCYVQSARRGHFQCSDADRILVHLKQYGQPSNFHVELYNDKKEDY